RNWNRRWLRSPTGRPGFPRKNSPRCASGSTAMACCSRSRCWAPRCGAGNGTQRVNWRQIVRSWSAEMKTIKVGTLTKWAAMVLVSLSTALPASLAVQDADAKEEKEKAKIEREQEREKVRLEREAERVYQQARKLASKEQWEDALKAFDEAIQK